MIENNRPALYTCIKDMAGWDAQRWPNFRPAELACRCGHRFCAGTYRHDPAFLDALQSLRTRLGRALYITSAYRCELWNAHVGGAPLSQHKNIAVDISTHNHDRAALVNAAKESGFTGIGLAKNFIHLDRRKTPYLWYYKGSYNLWQTS